MNKKLFLVLVLVSAILVAGSMVIAGKAIFKGPSGVVVEPQQPQLAPKIAQSHSATPMPQPAAMERKAAIIEATGQPQKGPASYTGVSGTPTEILSGPVNTGKDECDLARGPGYFITNWIYGDEKYAHYEDPEAFGCTSVYPFQVTQVTFEMQTYGPESFQAFVTVNDLDLSVPACPKPGAVICVSDTYNINLPIAGYFQFPLPLLEECCVYGPYFAEFHIIGALGALGYPDAVSDAAPVNCHSYNDYGTGWKDLVVVFGWPGCVQLYSMGYTEPQNDCPLLDTCGVSSITPPTITVLAGGTADFTANVYFVGAQTSCFLTVTPDPACPSCVTTVTPNPVVLPATSATITIQTSAGTTPGTYVFDVGGAKASATLIVQALNDSCEVQRWITATGYTFAGWSAGDQNVVLLDPATMCIACGPDVYPFNIRHVKSRWVNSTPASTSLDVIFHIFDADTPYCNGPGAEIYQFPATIAAWSPNYVTVDLPKVICVDGPFWLSAEYVDVQPVGNPFPALRFSSQTYDVACSQFNYYQGDWYAWEDFWAQPLPGYLYISAIGKCQGDTCPITCDMAQDNGHAAGYASWIWEGFQVAKFYNPQDYCEPSVYPYNIHDVDFPIYKFGAAVPEVNLQIVVYLQSQDSCNGPGPEIYRSEPYHITSGWYPAWNHIVLPEPVCVYEPFYIALRWAAGPEPMPSMMMDNNLGIPGDSCHQWYYDPDVQAWYEHHDWWAPNGELVGMTMIRVSGFTNSPDCNFGPCDTTLTTLAGGGVAYYFKTPPNDSILDMRFELPATYGGRLDYFRMTFYKAGTFGTPDVDYYVWLSDGIFPLDNNPPYGAVASFHVPYADIQWYAKYDTLYVYPYNLIFDAGESFHIGWTHAFDPGDTLSPLGDTSSAGGHRASGWTGTAWEDNFNYRYKIDAYVCPIIPEESTFTMKCTPSSYSCNPYDPPTNMFKVALTPIGNYPLPVTFSLSSVNPPAGITAAFSSKCAPPCTSDVEITIADPTLTYGNYNLTFQGVGSDGQTRTANVVLTVWDEDMIDFANGQQRVSDFGAVANGDASNENFLWYSQKPLYDGGFVIGTDGDHMALDIYDCDHYGFAPPVVGGLQEHMTITYDPVYNVNIAAGHYCCDEALTGVPGVPGECDSVFFIGIMDPPVEFSLKIKVYYNTGPDTIKNMYAGVFEDWDVSSGGTTDWGDMDTLHNMIWQYANAAQYLVFGLMKAPFYDDPMQSIIAIHNPTEVYPTGDSSINCGNDPGLPYLYRLMSTHNYRNYGYWTGSPDDHSMLISAPPFTLAPGEKHIEIWINFGRNTEEDFLTWSQWYHKVLRYVGFYRGDVNASDATEMPQMDVTDVVYLTNYLFLHGPAPIPYEDQGDVNADGIVNVLDVVYMYNFTFIGGPSLKDYVRFIPQKWIRPSGSLFLNPNWQ